MGDQNAFRESRQSFGVSPSKTALEGVPVASTEAALYAALGALCTSPARVVLP